MKDENDLAAVWIRFQRLPNGSGEQDQLSRAFERLDDMCRSEPAAAGNVIQQIIALDQSDEILANVGAGADFRRMLGVV